MFTKSGKKLVRIPISQQNDLPTPGGNNRDGEGDTNKNNHVNGHIHSILDDLVARGCTVTAIMPPTTTATKKLSNLTPVVSKSKKPRAKPDSLSQIRAAEKCCILSNDIIKPSQNRRELSNVRGSISSLRSSEAATITQLKTDQLRKKAAPSPDPQPQNLQFDEKSPPAETSMSKQPSLTGKHENPPNIHIRRTINGTEYVPFTPPSNAVKRERLIQVNEYDIKPTLETAVQCDLIGDEDSSSSESSSQSDWINEIIEEYEYLEDGEMYECQICGEVLPNHLSNLKHSMIHKESSLLCFRCGRLFPNTSKLLAHEEKLHAEDKLKIKKALRCPKLNCLKAFHSKRQLFDHIDQHSTRVTEHRCSKCQRSFPSPLQLLCHMNRRNCWT